MEEVTYWNQMNCAVCMSPRFRHVLRVDVSGGDPLYDVCPGQMEQLDLFRQQQVAPGIQRKQEEGGGTT